jgi:hypothetical protein
MMKKLVGAPLTGIAALAALFVWAPAATADTNDDSYLSAMAANNIASVGGTGDLIDAGHQVCGFLSPSTSPAMVTDYVNRASLYGGRFYTISLGGSHAPLTNSQAGMLVTYAIGTYCPNSEGAKHWGVGGPYPPHNPEGPYGTCKEGGACW